MSEHQPRSDSGKFEQKVTEQDILIVFDGCEDAFMTAGEIADRLDVTRQAVNYRLKQMHEKGLVERKKAGAAAVGWWVVEEEREPLSDIDPDEEFWDDLDALEFEGEDLSGRIEEVLGERDPHE